MGHRAVRPRDAPGGVRVRDARAGGWACCGPTSLFFGLDEFTVVDVARVWCDDTLVRVVIETVAREAACPGWFHWCGASPNALVLLFVLYPHLFAALPSLAGAMAAGTGSTAAFTVALAGRGGWSGEAVTSAAVQGLLILFFALLIGGFLDAPVRESDRRPALIRRADHDPRRSRRGSSAPRSSSPSPRQRLGREIHDTLAQGFASILLLGQAARRSVEDPELARDRLDLITATARRNLAEARVLVAALAPADLHGGASLHEALTRTVEDFGRECGLAVEVTLTGGPATLEPSSQVVLLRALQESLANVRKHAHASRVDVGLRQEGARAVLEIHDDGRGLPATRSDAGFGLPGMAARVEEVGGSLEWQALRQAARSCGCACPDRCARRGVRSRDHVAPGSDGERVAAFQGQDPMQPRRGKDRCQARRHVAQDDAAADGLCLAARADEHAEPGRVEDLHLPQVHDDVSGAVLDDLVQYVAHVRHGVDVETSFELHHSVRTTTTVVHGSPPSPRFRAPSEGRRTVGAFGCTGCREETGRRSPDATTDVGPAGG